MATIMKCNINESLEEDGHIDKQQIERQRDDYLYYLFIYIIYFSIHFDYRLLFILTIKLYSF